MGKTAIDEDHPAFRGVYIGETSIPAVKGAFDSSDFVLSVGSLKTDFNTAVSNLYISSRYRAHVDTQSFSYSMPKANFVELHHDHTLIQHAMYAGAGYRSLLPKLVRALTFAATKKGPLPSVTPEQSSASDPVSTSREGESVTHDEFWPLWSSFFQKGDMIIGETGTSSFGLLDEKLPAESNYLAQLFWCSIGWATGATLGACIVAKEQGRRCILFTGDGSM
jgi:pyruvate decarboxylase